VPKTLLNDFNSIQVQMLVNQGNPNQAETYQQEPDHNTNTSIKAKPNSI
jgi:hypothetical protein